MRRWLRPLLAVLVLFGATSVNALTLAQILTNVRRNIRDTASSTSLQRYSDTVLTDFVNEGQRAVAMRAWPMTATQSATSSVGSGKVAMPSDTIAIRRVMYNNRALKEVTYEQIDADQNYAAWISTTGTPVYWIRTFEDNANEILLRPLPASSGDTITVRYVSQPTDMASNSDLPFEGETRFYAYHDILVFYATERILEIEGLAPIAAIYQDKFEKELDVLNQNVEGHPVSVPAVPTKENKK